MKYFIHVSVGLTVLGQILITLMVSGWKSCHNSPWKLSRIPVWGYTLSIPDIKILWHHFQSWLKLPLMWSWTCRCSALKIVCSSYVQLHKILEEAQFLPPFLPFLPPFLPSKFNQNFLGLPWNRQKVSKLSCKQKRCTSQSLEGLKCSNFDSVCKELCM